MSQTAAGVGIIPATYLNSPTFESFLSFQTCVRLAAMTDAPPPTEQPPASQPTKEPGLSKLGQRLLLLVVAVLLAVVITSPIALSSGELVRWASSPNGLGLLDWWPWLVFIALDCAAFSCVLLAVYCAAVGKSAGVFGLLVWVFAGFSAFANYRHGIEPGAPADAWWFFPVMSILGPGLLEAVTHFIRHQVQTSAGSRAGARPKFGLTRWLPIVGAPRDTYGARRTAQILGISTVDEAVTTYHALCPNGSLRVVRAIRARDVAAAAERERVERAVADDAVKAARAAARSGGLTVDQLAAVGQTNGATRLRAVASTSRPSKATIRAAVGGDHQTGERIDDQTGLGDHKPQAIKDAATARASFPDGLPDQGAHALLKKTFVWSQQKTTDALRAYRGGADLTPSVPDGEA